MLKSLGYEIHLKNIFYSVLVGNFHNSFTPKFWELNHSVLKVKSGLVIGAVGWALPTPGGIGTSHFLMLQLFGIYELGEQIGVTFGIISKGTVFIFTILYGFIAIVVKYFTSKISD